MRPLRVLAWLAAVGFIGLAWWFRPVEAQTVPFGEFRGDYFTNTTLSGSPAATDYTPSINYNWGTGQPRPDIPADNFSVRWVGQFDFSSPDYTFTMTADDGIRLYVDGALLIDGWRDQSATTYMATKTLTQGRHEVKVEYYEKTVDAVAQVNWAPINCPAGEYLARYYNNMTLDGSSALKRCESSINHNWGTGSPGAEINADNFSGRWRGTFNFAAGDYTFTATADDGISVIIDGVLLIDGWRDQSATTYTATTTLTEGAHEVRVEYYENTGDAVAQVSWEQATMPPPPNTPKVVFDMGDVASHALERPITQDAPIHMLTTWMTNSGDIDWISGFKSGVSEYYRQGYAMEAIVWLAEHPDYAVSQQFLDDFRTLVRTFKGDGPYYGPLYIIVHSEIETYPAEYHAAIRDQFPQLLQIAHEEYDQAHVALGLGGYGWIGQPTRDLSYWDGVLRAGDFLAVQQMHHCDNVNTLVTQLRDSVKQLGTTYNKPVMVSHFELWGDASCQVSGFDSFLDQVFTDASMSELGSWGLFGWGFMDGHYISDPGPTYDKAVQRFTRYGGGWQDGSVSPLP